MIVFNSIILSLEGNTGVAAYGVIANLSLVVVSVYTGIAQGIQPLLSRYFGLSDRKGSARTLQYALILMAAFSGIVYTVIFVFASRSPASSTAKGTRSSSRSRRKGSGSTSPPSPSPGSTSSSRSSSPLPSAPARPAPSPCSGVYRHHPDGVPAFRPLRAKRGLVRLPGDRNDRRRRRAPLFPSQPQKGIKQPPCRGFVPAGRLF